MRRLLCSLVLAAASIGAAHAQFDGDFMLVPQGCEATGLCTLKNTVRFTDSSKNVWQADAGLMTDGASIPGIFQPIIGKPFESDFIKAAVIHDWYCDRHVRPWRQTHRVFYEALITQGVPTLKAKIMYFGVVLGGPKWATLIALREVVHKCREIFDRHKKGGL